MKAFQEALSDAENRQLSITRRRWAVEELEQKFPAEYAQHQRNKRTTNSQGYTGVLNPRTGEVYPRSGGGVINPRTGEFYPAQ